MMRAKISLIVILMFAFLVGLIAPVSAGAAVRRRKHVRRQTVYVKHRSKKHQAEIIGGSAAGGAAIGALAGGGKGALIGAGAGAAGGAIYNQATKKKKVVVNQ